MGGIEKVARVKAVVQAPKQPIYDPDSVKLDNVIQIESSNNPNAYNKASKARGLAQITPIALQDYNNLNPTEQYGESQLFDPQINQKVAQWLLTERIPQLLKAYNIPVTLENVLWAYNAGIGNVKNNIKPQETVDYIGKYNAIQEREAAQVSVAQAS